MLSTTVGFENKPYHLFQTEFITENLKKGIDYRNSNQRRKTWTEIALQLTWTAE